MEVCQFGLIVMADIAAAHGICGLPSLYKGRLRVLDRKAAGKTSAFVRLARTSLVSTFSTYERSLFCTSSPVIFIVTCRVIVIETSIIAIITVRIRQV